MPANLTPQYYEAEEAYKKAKTTEEKIEALQQMLSNIPKHKGTEKMQADIKKRLAAVRREGKKKKSKSTYNPFHVEKQGAGQVVLLGYPNTGKSTLVGTLTRAKVKIADYPFTTTVPLAGMMPFMDVKVQLVDTPPIAPEMTPSGLTGTIKEADAILILIDISSGECLDQLEETLSFLKEKNILSPDLKESFSPYLILANKGDMESSQENLEIIKEMYPGLEIHSISNKENDLEHLKKLIYDMLDVIRIYSKAPGKEADLEKPFTLKRGSSVLEFAEGIHKDFRENLKNAYVWGSSKFDGQAVPRDYILEDGDIVELTVD